MTEQDNKDSLQLLKDVSNVLGCRVKVRSVIEKGFTFVPDKVSVPDAFCLLYESDIKYNTMCLCQAKSGQYWIEITFSRIPFRETKYWNGKKFIKYEG